MPYFQDPLQNQDQQDAQASQVKLGGGQSIQAPQVAGSSAAQPGQKPQGSGFTSLDKYLQAGQAPQFGQEFSAKVQGDVNKAGQTLTQATDTVSKQIKEGGYALPEADIQAAIANPLQADTAKVKQAVNAQFTGPMGLEGSQEQYNQVFGAVEGAKQKAKSAGTEAGRFTLLDTYFGRPNYTQGEKALDNLLLQRGGGLDAQGLKAQAKQLSEQAKQAQMNLMNQAKQREAETIQTRQKARGALGVDEAGNLGTVGAIPELIKQLQADNAAKEAQRIRQSDALKRDIEDNVLSEDTLASLGLQEGQELYDIDLRKYLQDQGAPLSFVQTASPDQIQRYLALSEMAGVDPGMFKPEDVSKAGQVGSQFGFNAASLAQDVAARDAAYKAEVQALQDKMAGLLPQAPQGEVSYASGYNRADSLGVQPPTMSDPAIQQALSAKIAELNQKYGKGRKIEKQKTSERDQGAPRVALK